MIEQFIPQKFCLKCLGCCRFREMDSVWLPNLLDSEIEHLLKNNIPPSVFSSAKKILPVPEKRGAGFVCAFLDEKENKCKIYGMRPLDCQLYPFLLDLKNKEIFLAIDLHCPFTREWIKTEEFKKYMLFLAGLLASPQYKEILQKNPQIIQAYPEALDLCHI